MLSSPVSMAIMVVVLLVLVVFARPPRHTSPRTVLWAKSGLGLVHTGLHVLAVALVAWAALAVASLAAPGWAVTPTAYALGFVLGGVVGSLVFAVYLTLANGLWGAEGNHAFSAQRLPGYKNVLRLHIRSDGCLDVHAIGVDQACHRWRAVPEAANVDDAWVAPGGGGPVPHLIEQVTLGRPDPPTTIGRNLAE